MHERDEEYNNGTRKRAATHEEYTMKGERSAGEGQAREMDELRRQGETHAMPN
jgi:hypothetical protein